MRGGKKRGGWRRDVARKFFFLPFIELKPPREAVPPILLPPSPAAWVVRARCLSVINGWPLHGLNFGRSNSPFKPKYFTSGNLRRMAKAFAESFQGP